jgi:hypothetical protein
MRNLKKFLAMTLTMLMVFGAFSALGASAAFDDVTDYQKQIAVMNELGIIRGYDEVNFGPDDDVTRWQMALLMTKMMTGKVDSAYVENNLKSSENFTAFTDIKADHYIGSISYVANNGIVVGTSKTTFAPTESIIIQDVFTMVVRMLGYGSSAMNSNYPWSFIDKAIALGLDKDLPADYSNKAAATRGEVAVILFNALTAVKADRSTLGKDFFNLDCETVVITGTSSGNAYNPSDVVGKTVADVGYVAFNTLLDNGTVSTTNTRYILKSAFGITGDEDAFIGDSFNVLTNNNFKSFLLVEANSKEVISQDEFKGGAATTTSALTIKGAAYKAVSAYSTLNYAQGTKTNLDNEILVYANNGKNNVYAPESYVMDSNLNILDEDGNILLRWVTTYGIEIDGIQYANLNGTYLYEYEAGKFVFPNDYIWSLAKKNAPIIASNYGYTLISNTKTGVTDVNAYADVVLYDDDNDGNYDRAVYYSYSFGKVGTVTSYGAFPSHNLGYAAYTRLAINGVALDTRTNEPHVKNTEVKYIDADGNPLTYADIAGKYVLYNYSPLLKTLIVKEIFTTSTGLVTGVDLVAKTLTFNSMGVNLITGVVPGEKLAIGNATLAGAKFADISGPSSNAAKIDFNKSMGKNINYVEKDGKILAVLNAQDQNAAASYMVYVNSNPGFSTMGYTNALVYFDPAANAIGPMMNVVSIASYYGYWYDNINAPVTGLDTRIKTGDLLYSTRDALGNYDVSKVSRTDAIAYPVGEYDDSISGNDDSVCGRITFQNTVGTAVGLTKTLAPFITNANTTFIIWDGSGYNGFRTFKGMPSNGSSIDLLEDAVVYASVNAGTRIATFVYVKRGQVRDFTINNSQTSTGQFSTIIYVDATTVGTMQVTTAYPYGTGLTVGSAYTYTKAIDVINGGHANNIYTDYNFNARLEAGNFYYVQNGYVVSKINPDVTDSPISSARLTSIGKNVYTVKFNTTKYIGDEVDAFTNCFPVLYDAGVTRAGDAPLDRVADYGVGSTATGAASKTIIDNINATNAFANVYYYNGENLLNGDNFSDLYNFKPVFIMKSNTLGMLEAKPIVPDPDPDPEYTEIHYVNGSGLDLPDVYPLFTRIFPSHGNPGSSPSMRVFYGSESSRLYYTSNSVGGRNLYTAIDGFTGTNIKSFETGKTVRIEIDSGVTAYDVVATYAVNGVLKNASDLDDYADDNLVSGGRRISFTIPLDAEHVIFTVIPAPSILG